ncbi:hypothetical protein A2U01_0028320, partial [Trifolium medium]|nr:hypothetical protein [Trifolium medium]
FDGDDFVMFDLMASEFLMVSISVDGKIFASD